MFGAQPAATTAQPAAQMQNNMWMTNGTGEHLKTDIVSVIIAASLVTALIYDFFLPRLFFNFFLFFHFLFSFRFRANCVSSK